MSNEMMRQEIMEAIAAGERALASLRTAREKLNSAKNWGIMDMLGGGFFTSMVKRSRMEDASVLMDAAKMDLRAFQRELKDVNVPMNLRMEVGGFLSFADFFFDGLIVDYMVQSKINEAREQVEEAIRMVEMILRDLRAIE